MRVLRRHDGPPGQEDMPYLMMPGPVTTAASVRLAMMADWSPQDPEFLDLLEKTREHITALCGATPDHVCILAEGTASNITRDALHAFAPQGEAKTLVISNGALAQSAAATLDLLQRPYLKIEASPFQPVKSHDIKTILDADRRISHVWMVHCEPSTGIINPVEQLSEVIKGTGRTLIVDARCTLGGVPISASDCGISMLIGTSSSALESVPGIVPVVIHRTLLETKPASPSQACSILRAAAQSPLQQLETSTHTVAALAEALQLLAKEDGVSARHDRYRRNAATLVDGMKRMGFVPLLTAEQQGALVQAFHKPNDPDYDAERFAVALRRRNFAIPSADAKYLTVGTIGNIDHRVVSKFLVAVEESVEELGIRTTAPAAA
jgi:2-aminoethylphosphonate-pyruvate transaminase